MRFHAGRQTKKKGFLFPHFPIAARQLLCGTFAVSDGFIMVSVTFVGVVILLALVSPRQALYFHIGETEKKCFIEEIPDETMVIGELTC